jgi:uncharacterized membrane protein YcaP (DUF421 family)
MFLQTYNIKYFYEDNYMNDIIPTAIKSIISVTVLFILARIMGKKHISQLSFFDYVAGISIGSIAASFAVDPSVDYYHGITSIVIYAMFPITLSYLSIKSYKCRMLFDGMPSILIQNGIILKSNLNKTEMNINDLLEECRLKKAFDISEVEFAILETSGKLSLQMKAPNQPVTLRDMNLTAADKGLCINLIIDGKILDEHLLTTRKDYAWLTAELKNQNNNSPDDVLLAYLDTAGILKCYKKNSELPASPL